MSEMIERVAKAIQKVVNERDNAGDICTHEDAARAAIEAMRDLTKPMMFYGMDAMVRDGLEPTEAEFTRGYQAAIDAALNEEGKG